MKHKHHMTEADQADLVQADGLIVAGRALRQRVMTRLRGRAFRQRIKEMKA